MLETTFLSGFPESLENTKQECSLTGKRMERRRSKNVREDEHSVKQDGSSVSIIVPRRRWQVL